MNDMIIGLAEWALTGVLGVIATALWRQLRRMKTDADERERRNRMELSALKRGMQLQLRADLISMHHIWIADKGYMPVDVKSEWRDMYCAYEALGENGVISALYEDVKKAHVAPEPTDKEE